MSDSPLRLLVVSSPPPVKRLPGLFLALLDAGVELVFAGSAGPLPDVIATHERVSTVALPLERTDAPAGSIAMFRAAADLTRFLGPGLRGARYPRARAARRLLKLAKHPDANGIAKQAAGFHLEPTTHDRAGRAFREVERLLPADPALEAAMAAVGADAVLLVSRVMLGGPEQDVIKAARALNLPTVMLVWSWDNLSSKAALNEHPDHLLVWNELQVSEAAELHGIPPERVTALGAANFDAFFEELQNAPATRSERKTILYLGSSPKVALHEQPIFDRWLEAVRASDEPMLRDARVVLRPHPAAEHAWSTWTAPGDVEVSEPQAKIEPTALSQLLAGADAVVALNTSAEIEAAIAGVPVLTFRAGAEARGQEGSVHFTYLLEQNNGFVLDALTLDEHVAKLGAVVRGEWDPEALQGFVERFVRPRGLDRPVTPLLASTVVELAAQGRQAPAAAVPAPVRADGPGAEPRILVFTPPGLLRNVPDVFVELAGAGARLLVSGRRQKKPRIPAELKSSPQVEVVSLPVDEPEAVELLRAFRDAMRFRDPALEAASWPRKRATRRLLKLAGQPDWKDALAALAALRLPHDVSARVDGALRDIETEIPPVAELIAALAGLGPDLVFLVTRCTLSGHEGTVIKAARALGVPTLMLVWSWDNLSSKAVLHEHPDRLLVWNELQAGEATTLHGVDPARTEVLGAPNFDRFFAEVEEAGDERSGNTILYLGSSTNVAPAEPEIFERWLAAVRASADPGLRDAHVVVRPHPAGQNWLDWSPQDERVSVRAAEEKIDPATLAVLLAQADAVVALNTSAEIEAAIARRPVLTFRAGADAPGQEGSIHFSYLLEDEGGFVLDAATLDEHVARLAQVLAGDYDPAPIARFVERFVRPRGLDTPVAPLAAAAALELAGARSTTPAGRA